MDPHIWIDYLVANKSNFLVQALRSDASSFLFFLYKKIGLLGGFVTALMLGCFCIKMYSKYVVGVSSQSGISQEEWMHYVFLSVLLLPITWMYSLAPLTLIYLNGLKNSNYVKKVITILAMIVLAIFPPFGDNAAWSVYLSLVLMYSTFFIRDRQLIIKA
jgi:hypothetical protein